MPFADCNSGINIRTMHGGGKAANQTFPIVSKALAKQTSRPRRQFTNVCAAPQRSPRRPEETMLKAPGGKTASFAHEPRITLISVDMLGYHRPGLLPCSNNSSDHFKLPLSDAWITCGF